MWPPLPRWLVLDLTLRLTMKPRLARAEGPEAVRRRFEEEARKLAPPSDARFERVSLTGGAGAPMPALWAWRGAAPGERVLLYLHGGAYFAGSPDTHRHVGALLAGAIGGRTLLPDYRLAPECPFPAALDDALAACRHLLDQGCEPERLALAGDSAGGGLVFALLLRLEAEGLPQPAAVVAFSPWSDLTEEAPSLRRNAWRDPMLPAKRFREVCEFYLAGHDPKDPLASPAFGRFRAPPPALIFASRDEILADDATAMARTLRAAGGEVTLDWARRLPHAWPVFAGLLPEADASLARAGAFLAERMGRDE